MLHDSRWCACIIRDNDDASCDPSAAALTVPVVVLRPLSAAATYNRLRRPRADQELIWGRFMRNSSVFSRVIIEPFADLSNLGPSALRLSVPAAGSSAAARARVAQGTVKLSLTNRQARAEEIKSWFC